MRYSAIEAERARNRLTKEEFASKIGVSSKTYYNWLNGTSPIPSTALIKMAKLIVCEEEKEVKVMWVIFILSAMAIGLIATWVVALAAWIIHKVSNAMVLDNLEWEIEEKKRRRILMKKTMIALVIFIAVVGASFTVSSCELIGTGKVDVQYSYKGGVKDEVLNPGLNFINPFLKVKEFTVGNEQLILIKDKRDGSKENEALKAATSDDASISVSFQMSYRYNPEKVVDTYKKSIPGTGVRSTMLLQNT